MKTKDTRDGFGPLTYTRLTHNMSGFVVQTLKHRCYTCSKPATGYTKNGMKACDKHQ